MGRMAKCPSCGGELDQDARFCGACGASVPPPARFCWACGGALEIGALFCGLCGSPVDDTPAPNLTDAAPDDESTATNLTGAAQDDASNAATAALRLPDEPSTLVMPPAAPLPPPPSSPPPSPPLAASGDQSGGRRGLSTQAILAAVIVLLVAVAAALAVVLLTRSDKSSNGHSTVGGASPAQTPTAGASSTDVGASPSAVASVSATTAPSESYKQKIIASLNAYFDGINTGDYSAAWNQRTPRLNKGGPLQKFAKADSTSQNSNVVIHWIKKKDLVTAIAYVTFTSTQDPALAPNGIDSRDDWTLEYTMKLVNGRWLIDGTAGHNGTKYTSG